MEYHNQNSGHTKSISKNAIQNLKAQLLYSDSTINIDDVRLLINEFEETQLFQNSSCIENKRYEDALRANVKKLQELNILESRLQHTNPIKEILKPTTETVVEIIDADFAWIWVINTFSSL